jgi:hypothetical protein
MQDAFPAIGPAVFGPDRAAGTQTEPLGHHTGIATRRPSIGQALSGKSVQNVPTPDFPDIIEKRHSQDQSQC